MKKIELRNNKVLNMPNEWILLNPQAASNSTEVYVVEMRNGAKYGLPHFIYFSNKKIGNELNDEEIFHLCCEAWPEFEEKVLKKQVKLIPDLSIKGQFVNADEWENAPIIGIFPIPELDGTKDYKSEYPAWIE